MQLSDEERERIRLEEQYRAEVRSALGGKKESWLDKLGVPMVILVATAIVSGLLVPAILGRVETKRRALDLQSRLIEQLVADDSAAQMSLSQRFAWSQAYRSNLLEIELEKRLLSLLPVDAAERVARRAELAEDLGRERERHSTRHSDAVAAMGKYLIEFRGNLEWVKLHYGDPPALETYAGVAMTEYATAINASAEAQNSVMAIWQKAHDQVRACSDESACRKIVADARIEMQKYAGTPDFAKWNEARGELVRFISTTEPRI